jgi:hypothetical protein
MPLKQRGRPYRKRQIWYRTRLPKTPNNAHDLLAPLGTEPGKIQEERKKKTALEKKGVEFY